MLVSNCSNLAVEIVFKSGLANSFYKGCAAHSFTDIPFMKYSDGVSISTKTMPQFAGAKGKRLLLIVDQMKLSLDYFAEAVSKPCNDLLQILQDILLFYYLLPAGG